MKSIVNWILDFLEAIVIPIIQMLPTSPFQQISIEDFGVLNQVLGWINFFVPIGHMISFTATYLTSVLIWYGARWTLRVAKYID